MDEIEKPTPQQGHTLSMKEAKGEGGWQVGVTISMTSFWCSEGDGVKQGLKIAVILNVWPPEGKQR